MNKIVSKTVRTAVENVLLGDVTYVFFSSRVVDSFPSSNIEPDRIPSVLRRVDDIQQRTLSAPDGPIIAQIPGEMTPVTFAKIVF